jgi:hypothetical protein
MKWEEISKPWPEAWVDAADLLEEAKNAKPEPKPEIKKKVHDVLYIMDEEIPKIEINESEREIPFAAIGGFGKMPPPQIYHNSGHTPSVTYLPPQPIPVVVPDPIVLEVVKPPKKTGLKSICAKEDVKLLAYHADGTESKILFKKHAWWYVDVTTNVGDIFDMTLDNDTILMGVPVHLFVFNDPRQ